MDGYKSNEKKKKFLIIQSVFLFEIDQGIIPSNEIINKLKKQ